MYDIAIIGAGPAGASAALFAAKAGKSTLLLDNDKSMTKRAWIENHYGVEGITGPDMVELGKKQAAHFGAELVAAQVTDISKSGDGFVIAAGENATYEAKHVILATGVLVELAEKAGVRQSLAPNPGSKQSSTQMRQGRPTYPDFGLPGHAREPASTRLSPQATEPR